MVPPKPGAASPAAAVAHAAVTDSVVRLLAHDPGVRLGDDPEDVHQMRVATRRLRSDLRTFRPVIDRDWSDPVRGELEWLGGLLGAVRDTEVLLDRLDARLDALAEVDRDAGKRLLDTLRTHRDDARVAAARRPALRSLSRAPRRARRGHARVGGHARSRPQSTSTSSDSCASRGASCATPSTRSTTSRPTPRSTRCASSRSAPATPPRQRTPTLGRSARDFARRAAALQDVLGEHQDAVVAEHWLRDHAVSRDDGAVEHAFVAGQLVTIERQAADDARAQWRRAWKRLRRARPSLWP